MFRLITYCVVLAVVLVAAFVACVVYLPSFNDLRQSYISNLVSDFFERDIEVNGDVNITLGQYVDVEVTDISVAPLSGSSGDWVERIDRGRITMPLLATLFGQAEITALDLSGVELEIAGEKRQATGQYGFAGFPTRYLTRQLSGNLDINDVKFRYINKAAGWDEVIAIERLTSRYNGDASEIHVVAEGKFNEVGLSYNADFQNPARLEPGAPADFSMQLEIPGSKSQLDGTIDTSVPIAVLDANLSSQSDSLGDLLDALGLKRVVEGKGQLRAGLTGPLDSVTASSLAASASGERLERISVNGSIENLTQETGLDLEFSANWREPDVDLIANGSFLDLSVTGISGKLTGDVNKLAIDQFFLNTNSVSFQFRNIGPISVQQLAKDDQGRLGIIGIHVLDGPADKPVLDLKGNVRDALNFTGIDLSGKIDIPTVDALSLEGGNDPDALGYLRGEVSVSDEDGSLGIESLSGSVEGSELISLDLELKADDLADGDEIAVKADLDIQDVAKFANALGATTAAKGGLKFNGSFLVADGEPGIDGDLEINTSKITGRLVGTNEDGKIGAKGNIQSKTLRISDLRDLWEINLIRSNQDYDPVTMNEDAFAGFTLALDIDVGSIVEGGKSVGAFKGALAYSDQVFRLDPFSLTYLNGKVSAATTIDTSRSPAAISSNGSITRLALGRLLRELRVPEMASGTLSARFNMNGSGTDIRQVLANGNGRIDASLSGGVIQTNLLDLTGMNFVSWMFTQSREETTKLVCAVFPLNFKNGRANTSQIVLETKNVQAVGKGSIDIKGNRINLEFQPIPISNNAAARPTPFKITGALSKPEISLEQGAMPQRMATDFFTAPLNTLANIFGGNNNQAEKTENRPCVVRKASNGKKN